MENRDALYPYADGSRFRAKTKQEVFREIFEQSTWNLTHHDSVSGEGSTTQQTALLRKELLPLLQLLSVKRILDIPCGDFFWMQHLNLRGIDYIGGDIVPELVLQNQERYACKSREFMQLDLTEDTLPDADLVFCRDCLVHLSQADIRAALVNIASSKATWLLMTHFPGQEHNKNIVTGGWRPLNFCLPPFNLPPPVHILNEGCTEMGGVFSDKSLGCWEVAKIKRLVFLKPDI